MLSDEVYEHLTFDGRRHASAASVPALAARTAVVSSFGKSFHTTGWKIGYVSAPAAITDEIRRVHQFVTFAVNTPLQHAYAEFLARGVDFEAVGRFYQAKRDRFLSLTRASRLVPLSCAGTYFMLMDYSPIGARPGPGDGDAAAPRARRRVNPHVGVHAPQPGAARAPLLLRETGRHARARGRASVSSVTCAPRTRILGSRASGA